MSCSLYGKLPSKRDFVAVRAPRAFLDPWEPWLQSAVSSSRDELGKEWQAAFLTAPIWRFWLGADICGRSAIGAFMPSLDGIGRYFPLTVFAFADGGAGFAPPEIDLQESWFEAVEAFLLSALDQNIIHEDIAARIDDLTPPTRVVAPPISQAVIRGNLPGSAPGGSGGPFEALRLQQHEAIYASATFWWTIGGQSYPPAALCAKHMPDPYIFSSMLTGRFANDALEGPFQGAKPDA